MHGGLGDDDGPERTEQRQQPQQRAAVHQDENDHHDQHRGQQQQVQRAAADAAVGRSARRTRSRPPAGRRGPARRPLARMSCTAVESVLNSLLPPLGDVTLAVNSSAFPSADRCGRPGAPSPRTWVARRATAARAEATAARSAASGPRRGRTRRSPGRRRAGPAPAAARRPWWTAPTTAGWPPRCRWPGWTGCAQPGTGPQRRPARRSPPASAAAAGSSQTGQHWPVRFAGAQQRVARTSERSFRVGSWLPGSSRPAPATSERRADLRRPRYEPGMSVRPRSHTAARVMCPE